MAGAAEAPPSNILDFNMQDAEITARDIGCGNINGHNIQLEVNHYNGIPGRGGSSKDIVTVASVISWLSPYTVDYFPRHDKARSQRAEHTGKWFFNSLKYRLWATVGFGKYRNLACVGIPGVGKTTMAASVIKSLQDSFLAKRGFDTVLYAYFRHDTQSKQSIPFVLASLLLQVIQHKRKVSAGVRKFYKDYSSRKDIPLPIDVMVALLRSELSGFGRAYIIVDALDEYSLPDYFPSHALVEELQRLNAKLLITSRYDVGYIPNTFSTIRISAHESDIRIFVRKHLSGHLRTVVACTPGLLEEIVSAVIIKSAGMFIVATLLVSCIPNTQPLTANELRASIKELPTGIDDTYDMAMTRIQEQEPHLAELGKQALYWVYFSKRRLTVMELRHALSFQRSKAISNDDLIGEDRIRSACAGLISFVKLKDKRKTVECQFSHFTTREFLDRSWRKYLPDGERQITETCLGYLAAAVSGVPPDVTRGAQQDYSHNSVWRNYCQDYGFALCDYAADCWADHARAIDEAFDLNAGAIWFKHPISPHTADMFTTLIYPTFFLPPKCYWILYFARFGLLELLQKHTDDNNSQKVPIDHNDILDGYGRTALHLSALGGHPKVIQFLLDSGADVNVLDGRKGSPLHYAVQAGSSGVATVQLLLDCGANVDQPRRTDRAPVSYAIEPELTSYAPSPDIIRLLLLHDVDIYRIARGRSGDTPLSLARKSENPEIKQLLEEYARTHPQARRLKFRKQNGASQKKFVTPWTEGDHNTRTHNPRIRGERSSTEFGSQYGGMVASESTASSDWKHRPR